MRDQWKSRATISKVVFVALALLAAGVPGVVTTTALAQTAKSKADKPQGVKPAEIDRNGVLILTRGAILALDQANKTGNYTVLRDLGAPGFQANNAARLSEIFASHRQREFDLGAVAVLEPQLTLMPQIEPNGMLHMAGYFPSLPLQVDFELLFAPVERQWRLFGISVNLSKGGLQAPEAQDRPAAASPAGTPDAPTAEVKAKPKT